MSTRDVATTRQIASLLGVSSNQVYMWNQRRARNGFPEPVACCIGKNGSGGPRRSPMWRVQEVIDWYADYDPTANCGPPLGNQNGLKHGRYVGMKPRKEASGV